MNTTISSNAIKMLFVTLLMVTISACGSFGRSGQLPAATPGLDEGPGPQYIVGPLDGLEIFVWRNPELSTSVTVRPDGRISVPLIEDLAATGQTPSQLARAIEKELGVYIQSPIVTVMVSGFSGPFAQQVRVVGAATEPQAIPYRANMTVLDLMIAVGGLTEFASGNRAVLVRTDGGSQSEYRVRLSSLLKDGDISANVSVMPGDVLIIPESIF